MSTALSLDGKPFEFSAISSVLSQPNLSIRLGKSLRQRIQNSRKLVESKVRNNEVVYGVTTGFGKLSRIRIPSQDLRRLQRNLIRSHATGVGPVLSLLEARWMLFLRIHSLSQGFSGVRVELIETLISMLERGVIPVIPEQGSVGASGDLAPLAHLAMVVQGEGEAFFRGKRMSGAKAMAAGKIRPVILEAKEGLALINGTQLMTAIGACVFVRAQRLSKLADIAGALSLEALKGSEVPFDTRIAKIRPHPGHAKTAANLKKCLAGSQVIPSHLDCEKVQDPYSLRCMPQVHGAVKDALAHVGEVLEREIHAVTDNPLVFAAQNEILSGGNFHGQPVSVALDYLGLSLCTLGSISERRIENMVNPDLSGLPAFLVSHSGLNSGFMIPQVVAASLVSENKIHAHPASVDTIPTSANKEDHVSMGPIAARKARTILENVETILAIELLCAAQGREFDKKFKAGRGAQAAYHAVRKLVPALHEDRFLAPDIEKVKRAIVSGEIVKQVEAELGGTLFAL